MRTLIAVRSRWSTLDTATRVWIKAGEKGNTRRNISLSPLPVRSVFITLCRTLGASATWANAASSSAFAAALFGLRIRFSVITGRFRSSRVIIPNRSWFHCTNSP